MPTQEAQPKKATAGVTLDEVFSTGIQLTGNKKGPRLFFGVIKDQQSKLLQEYKAPKITEPKQSELKTIYTSFGTAKEKAIKEKFWNQIEKEHSTENLYFLAEIHRLYSKKKNIQDQISNMESKNPKNTILNLFFKDSREEQLKNLKESQEKLKTEEQQTCQELYETFIKKDASTPINVSSATAAELSSKQPKTNNKNEDNQNENPQVAWRLEDFAKAAQEIRGMVEKDSVKRFIDQYNKSDQPSKPNQPSTKNELNQSLGARLQRFVTATIAKSGSKKAEKLDSSSVQPSNSSWMFRRPPANLSQETKPGVPAEPTEPQVPEVACQQSKSLRP